MSQDERSYLIDRVRDLSERIEAALRILEKRTEQTIEMREQLSAVQRSLHEVWKMIRGEGIDRPGLQQQLYTMVQRFEDLDCLLEKLETAPARLQKIEEGLKTLLETSSAVAVAEATGKWTFKVETAKQKLVLLGVIVGGLLASSQLWQIIQAALAALKR